MATDIAIKFYKGTWGATTASANSLANAGGIYFDETSKQIYVNGVAYGGAITDATFTNSVLTITKADNTTFSLDFTDTASASATMQVFNQLTDYIGVADGHIGTALDYSNTNYLTTSTNLVGADRVLDAQIKSVNDRIDGLDVSNVDTVDITDETNGDKTFTFNGVSQTNGLIEVGTVGENVLIKKVAFTGNAADVAIADAGSVIIATNVEDALQELANQITAGDVSIDGYKGAFTTDSNSFATISTNSKKLEVKLNANGYITKDTDGLNLQHVDTNGTSTTDTDLATVKTVTAHIEDLDVDAYAQAALTDSNTSFTVYGINEVDGKIGSDATTTAAKIVFADTYNASNNRVALESTVTNAIEGLDVGTIQPVGYTAPSGNDGAKLTFHGIAEQDGEIVIGTTGGTELQFAKVATTGKAEDVIVDSTTLYLGSTVDEAIQSIDSRIKDLEDLPKYDVQVVESLPANPDEDNMHIIYLMAEAGQSQNDIYGEYIVLRSGSEGHYTYSYEKLGTTSANLNGYVKTVQVNGKSYTVGTDTTTLNVGDVITSIADGDDTVTTANGFTHDYIDSEVTVISTKDTANGTYAASVISTATVKVQAVGTSGDNAMGLAEASDVKAYVGTQISNLTLGTATTGTNVSVAYSETNGIVNIEVTENYADVTVSTNAEPSLTVTDGTKLAVGSDIEKVKEYTDYKISTVINSLDADVTSTSTAIATVQVVEQDGKITAVNVTTQEAGVVYSPATTGENPTQANLTASSNTGAVIGTDIAAIKSYIDAKANEASQTTVTNANATIPVGTTAETILGTVAGVAITAKASFTWEEYQ